MGGSATVYKGRWKSRDMTVAVKTSVQGIPDSEVWVQSQYIMRIKAEELRYKNMKCLFKL